MVEKGAHALQSKLTNKIRYMNYNSNKIYQTRKRESLLTKSTMLLKFYKYVEVDFTHGEVFVNFLLMFSLLAISFMSIGLYLPREITLSHGDSFDEMVWITNTELLTLPRDYLKRYHEKFSEISLLELPEKKKYSQEKKDALTCGHRNVQDYTLCQLGLENYCRLVSVGEMAKYTWAIEPIYSFKQDTKYVFYYWHERFKDYVESFGIQFCTVEMILPGQKYWVTEAGREPYDIQLTHNQTFYIRENLVDVAIRKLPSDWEYVTWIDAHQIFDNPYWWEESIIKSAKYDLVQMFQEIKYLTNMNLTTAIRGKAFQYIARLSSYETNKQYYYGNAWMMSKETYKKLGFFDECPGAGCDVLLNIALLPSDKYIKVSMSKEFIQVYEDYIQETRSLVKFSDVAVVRGNLWHFYHGAVRAYNWYSEKIVDSGFNHKTGLIRDENNTMYLADPDLAQWFWDMALKLEEYYDEELPGLLKAVPPTPELAAKIREVKGKK